MHQALEQVFSKAFAGCAQDFETVRASARWHELVAHFQTLPSRFASGTPEAVMLRLGPGIFSGLLARYPFPEALERARKCQLAKPYRADSELLAAIILLGNALQDQAALSPPFPAKFSLTPEQHRQVPWLPQREFWLNELVDFWHEHGAEGRLQALKLLTIVFASVRSGIYTSNDDRAGQTAENVLPLYLARGVLPNCIGKAVLDAGFLKRVQADGLAMAPIWLNARFSNLRTGELATICSDHLKAGGVMLSSERASSLEAKIKTCTEQADELDWLHMTIAVRIDTDTWALVDPNLLRGSAPILPNAWRLQDAHAQLTHYQYILPGLTLLKHDAGRLARVDLFRHLCETNGLLIKKFVQEKFALGIANATKAEIARALADSNILSYLMQEPEFGPEHINQNAAATYKAIRALLQHVPDMTSAKKASGERPLKIAWQRFPTAADDWLLSFITDQEARDALITLLYRFGKQGIRQMESADDQQRRENLQFHPVCQFGAIAPTLGFAVTAHVASCMGLSEQVERRLIQHVSCQYRLLYSAGSLIKSSQTADPHAWQSAATLANLPFILQSAGYVLEGLVEQTQKQLEEH